MLEEILAYLHNWFVSEIYKGHYEIEDGGIELAFLQEGQYFRIFGSIFNDGLYKYGDALDLTDEGFDGVIWALKVPKQVVKLADEISEWQDKYGEIVSSPYTSESFGGYSYSKAAGATGQSASGSAVVDWQTAFANRLQPYRKLKEVAPVKGNTPQPRPYKKPFNPDHPYGV